MPVAFHGVRVIDATHVLAAPSGRVGRDDTLP